MPENSVKSILIDRKVAEHKMGIMPLKKVRKPTTIRKKHKKARKLSTVSSTATSSDFHTSCNFYDESNIMWTDQFDQFHDYQNKCRCCFQKMDTERHGIDSLHRDIFYKLTSIDLIHNGDYSDTLCSECNDQLMKISEFAATALELQSKFLDYALNQTKVKLECTPMDVEVFEPTRSVDVSTTIDQMIHDIVKAEPLEPMTNCSVKVEKLDLQNYEFDQCDNSSTDNVPKKRGRPKGWRKADYLSRFSTISVDAEAVPELIVEKKKRGRQLGWRKPEHLKKVKAFSLPPPPSEEGADPPKKRGRPVGWRKVDFLKKFNDDDDDYTDQAKPGRSKRNSIDEDARIKFCDLCDYQTQNKSRMDNHMKSKHWTRYLVCEKCKWRTRIKRYMMYHNTIYHNSEFEPPQNDRYGCPWCEKSFSAMTSLFNHMDLLHGSNSAQTDQTGVPFKQHVCHICGYRTKFKSSLDYHLAGKHKEKNDRAVTSLCPHCGKSFSCKIYLASHMKYHHQMKEAECYLCNANVLMNEFHRHLRAFHPDAEPEVQCPSCPRKYFHNFFLNYHYKRVHEAKFPCRESGCDKIFDYPKSMEYHYKTAHCKMKYDCLYQGCTYRNIRKAKMRKHMLNVHLVVGDVKLMELK